MAEFPERPSAWGGLTTILWPGYPIGVAPWLITTNWTTMVQQKGLPTTGVYKNVVSA